MKMFGIFFSSLFMIVVAAGDDYFCSRGCPPFWTSFGRSCYRYFGEPRTWVEAEEVCKAFAGTRGLGHLVSIVSEDENSFIVQLVTGMRTIDGVSATCTAHHGTLAESALEEETQNQTTIEQKLTWIGLTDLKKEGTFAWTDGTKVTYTNWDGEDNIEITENRDNREYKARRHEKGEDRDEKSTDNLVLTAEGNVCGYIPATDSFTETRRRHTWEKSACDDTTAISPYVCRIAWV